MGWQISAALWSASAALLMASCVVQSSVRQGTFVVCLVDDQRIVIAADSLVLGFDASGGEVPAGLSKKIQSLGPVHVALAGIAIFDNGFDVTECLKRSALRSVAGLASHFDRTCTDSIGEAYVELLTRRPGLRARRIPKVEVLLASWEDGRPIVETRGVEPQVSGSRLELETYQGMRRANDRGFHIILMGNYDGLDVSEEPAGNTPAFVEKARSLVETASRTAPDRVGPPINIVVLENGRSDWHSFPSLRG